MLFQVTTSASSYIDGRHKKNLEKLGFKFKPHDETYDALYKELWKSNKQIFYMGYEQNVEVEINSLEDLLQFAKKFGKLIIDENTIEIYDDYRE